MMLTNCRYRAVLRWTQCVKNNWQQSNIQNLATSSGHDLNAFTTRSHTCGQLRAVDQGEKVSVCGWLKYNRYNRFLVLGDTHGTIQAIVDENRTDLISLVKTLSLDSVLRIDGVLKLRPKKLVNPKMPTGEVEIIIDCLHLLNKAPDILPFPTGDTTEPKNLSLRLQHRYLDLRRPKMQKILKFRSDIVHRMRRYLAETAGFIEVETPTLFRQTPGGAAEFLVPAGAPNLGRCYALPQSPQQFKQLLMVAGLDRYFQIARCYRDEGAQSDRQPEFTQVDLELSFSSEEGVIQLVEALICQSWPPDMKSLEPRRPFRRLNYSDCMRLYGTDKPDLRCDWTIEDCSSRFDCLQPLCPSEKGTTVKAVVCRGAISSLPDTYRNCLNEHIDRIIGERQLHNLRTEVRTVSDENWFNLKDSDRQILVNWLNVQSDDIVIFSWGQPAEVQKVLGLLRHLVAGMCGIRAEEKMQFVWITDFPLFTREKDSGHLQSCHHPFTAPKDDHVDRLFRGDPQTVTGQHYDLVLNGVELGGGSIRIHDAQMQRFVLETVLNCDTRQLEHLLCALEMGAPPHGGFALGLDRYIALLSEKGDPSIPIREVIAFPKTIDGKDIMSGAPTEPGYRDRSRYAIEFLSQQNDQDESKKSSSKVDSKVIFV